MRLELLALLVPLLLAGCGSDEEASEGPPSVTIALPPGDPAAAKQAEDRCAILGKHAQAKGVESQGALFECQ